MCSSLTLYECLQQVSLEKYHGKFTDRGIFDIGGLLSLTMQDYPSLGISSMADRENLFYLIQTIKTLQPSSQDWKLRSGTKNGGVVQLKDPEVKGKEKKSGAKRPRESSENSPVAVKVKTKTEDKSSSSSRLSSLSRTTECVNLPGFYNYGVPSNKPKPSPGKRHHPASPLGTSRIQVCVRKRPLSKAEMQSNDEDIVTVTSNNTIELTAPKLAVDLTKYMQKYQFLFDEAFHEGCSNEEVYRRTAQPLIKTVFNGGKATCFAYGCTGSGKTFTMLGNEDVQGIYILAASEIFSILHNGTYGDGLGLWISFYEIYCGQLLDLLNERTRLFAREDANHQVCITGLTERHVHNVEELMEIIEFGGEVRSTGATGVNADSSRSHAILQLELKVVNTEEHLGRFSFIDLAGCERAADVTDTDKQTRVEGAEINQSLLALKECIRALDLDSRHTPFRQSKLTQVLKDSFVGNCQTCMIANISPNKSCSENTLNTLRYADRVKELKKDIPVTPPNPRPLTVPAVIPESDQLLAINKTYSSSRVQIQATKKLYASPKGANVLDQVQSSLVKPNTPNIETDGPLRPKTSSTTTTLSAPRTREFASLRHTEVTNSGNTSSGRLNAKKQLVVKPEMLRPQTAPDVVAVKSQLIGNKVQNRPRTLKHKTGNAVETNFMKTLFEKPEKGLPVMVQDSSEEKSNCEDILVVSQSGTCDTLSKVAQPGYCVDYDQDVREIQHTERKAHADKPLKDISPPSRNNRYSSGIKTRLSKLFNKGSLPVEDPKVVESQLIQDNIQAPNLKPTSNGIHLPNREMAQLLPSASEQCESCLNIAEEQFVSSHHTQLAMVTGLCHEEMVLLKQLNSGQKDFKDYLELLQDILTQKAACIESLQEKLSKFPAW